MKNLKLKFFIKTIGLIVTSLVILSSCQQEPLDQLTQSEGKGYLRLNLELDVSTDGGRAEAVNTDDWNVIVYYESTTEVFNFANFTDVPSEIELTPGDYTVVVSSEDESVAFDNPFYTGTSDVITINSGDVVPVTVNASQANVEVSVSYSSEVLADFTTMTTTITSSSGSLVFGASETRSGFFVPGEDLSISADLTFTNPDLTTEVRTVTGTITGTSAQDHYQITVDYTLNGSISPLTIMVDETTTDIPITISELSKFVSNYGGSGIDEANDIVATSDGGYLIAGETYSSDGDITGFLGAIDGWLLKTDKDGMIQWSTVYGGSQVDRFERAIETSDGGFLAVGSTSSTEVPLFQGGIDGWIVKVNANGVVEWQKAIGSTGTDFLDDLVETSGNEYAVIGHGSTTTGDSPGTNGSIDFWLFKLDVSGTILWSQNYGGPGAEFPYAIKEANDNGLVMTGYTTGSGGDVSAHQGGSDFWTIKTDVTGTLLWEISLGSAADERSYDLDIANDGSIYVSGYSRGTGGNVSANNGGFDFWMTKLNDSGALQWERNFGGTSTDVARSVTVTSTGDAVFVGEALSTDVDITNPKGGRDIWALKYDNAGNLLWSKNYGGLDDDYAYGIEALGSGGLALGGWSRSSDGDIPANNGNSDGIILVVDENGNL